MEATRELRGLLEKVALGPSSTLPYTFSSLHIPFTAPSSGVGGGASFNSLMNRLPKRLSDAYWELVQKGPERRRALQHISEGFSRLPHPLGHENWVKYTPAPEDIKKALEGTASSFWYR